MTGWRIGYIFAQEEIIDCINYINEAIVYSPVAVSQRCALSNFMQTGEYCGKASCARTHCDVDEFFDYLRKRTF